MYLVVRGLPQALVFELVTRDLGSQVRLLSPGGIIKTTNFAAMFALFAHNASPPPACDNILWPQPVVRLGSRLQLSSRRYAGTLS